MKYFEEVHGIGATRTVEKFLFFPKTLHGVTIWLEKVKIKQDWICKTNNNVGPGYWAETYFLDENNHEMRAK